MGNSRRVVALLRLCLIGLVLAGTNAQGGGRSGLHRGGCPEKSGASWARPHDDG